MQKITPFLWFNDNAEAAVKFYTTIFKDSKILSVSRKGKKFFTATIKLQGQEVMLLNGGPLFPFTPAISFFVRCKDQREVDYYWNKLSKGGKKSRCGWLQDKYGLSWQIIPDALGKYLTDKNPEKAGRAWDAMMKMSKIDIAALKKAHQG